MRRQTLVALFVMALWLSSGAVSLPQSQALLVPGTESAPPEAIRGRVIDAHGNPVPKARIHVIKVGANGSGRVIYYWTDKEGYFSIRGLSAGVYDIFVSKEEDNYADTEFFFYSTRETSGSQAVVSEQQPPPLVTIPLGPRAGRITGRVVDAVSGARIVNATLTFRRPENKNMFLMTGLNQPDHKGSFDFLLPSAPVTIEATAQGYARWSYRSPGSNKQMDLVTLEPGQTIEMVIKMRPVTKR
jgi:hypothetical protein